MIDPDGVLAFFKRVVATCETVSRNLAPNRRLRVSDLDVIHLITLNIRLALLLDNTNGGRNNLRFDSDISIFLHLENKLFRWKLFRQLVRPKGITSKSMRNMSTEGARL